mgnify:CR=1 FL=1
MLNALNISENTVRRIINKFPTKAEKGERALKQTTLRKISSTSGLQPQASFSKSVSNFDGSLTDFSPPKKSGKEDNTDEESFEVNDDDDEEDEERLIGNLQRLEKWLLDSI